jgi:hypothetical protein
MMKKIKLKYITAICLLILSTVAQADVFDDVINAMKEGNAKEVAKHFNVNVDLTINDQEGVYSKQQAEIMIKGFLARHHSKDAVIQHRGSSAQGAKYAIAKYETEQGVFRVYIFMKLTGDRTLVHEMRIEKE